MVWFGLEDGYRGGGNGVLGRMISWTDGLMDEWFAIIIVEMVF